MLATYIVSYIGIPCELISVAILILAGIGWGSGLGFTSQLIQIALVGFNFFILPWVGEFMISGKIQIKACLLKMLNT